MIALHGVRKALRVLLVEDSRADAILIEKALTDGSALQPAVQKVESLTKALRVIGEEVFDVVLLDLSLPDTTGFNGLLSIQNIAPKLPVIILTAHQDETTAFDAVGHGAQDYLFKDKVDGNAIKRAMRYAIQRKQFEDTLITRAHFDPLTGLANRALLENRLEVILARKTRSGDGVGVMFLDLNKFKFVNDTYGHAVGDELLKEAALRMKKSVRVYDTVARFGGDEFALLIDGIESRNDCTGVANKIIKEIGSPFFIGGKELEIGVSIGIAVCLKGNTDSSENLLKKADSAMYSVKSRGKSDFQFVDASPNHLEDPLAKAHS